MAFSFSFTTVIKNWASNASDWFFQTRFGHFCWNLHTCIWSGSIIHKALKDIKVEQMAPNAKNQTINAIFRKCHFQRTWFFDSKIHKIEEALTQAEKELIDGLIAEVQKLPKSFDVEDEVQNLKAKFPLLTEDQLWKLLILKFAKETFGYSAQEDFSKLKIPAQTFSTEQGKEHLLQFLLDDAKSLDPMEIEKLEPKPKNNTERLERKEDSNAGFQVVDEEKENDIEPSLPPPVDVTGREAILAIQDLLLKLMGGSSIALIIANSLIPKKSIKSFKTTGNQEKQNFTITLNQAQSTQLGENGTRYLLESIKKTEKGLTGAIKIKAAELLLNNLVFKATKKISGEIHSKEQKITFTPSALTGETSLGDRTLLSMRYEANYGRTGEPGVHITFAPLDDLKNPKTQLWSENDFTSTFEDFVWPSTGSSSSSSSS